MLLFCMENQGLTRVDLVPCIGSKSKVSERLARKVPLNLAMIQQLHETFGIPVACLTPEYAVAKA